VEATEDDDGYITLRGQPPAQYYVRARVSQHHDSSGGSLAGTPPTVSLASTPVHQLHYRLRRGERIEMEAFSLAVNSAQESLGSEEDMGSEASFDQVKRSSSNSRGGSGDKVETVAAQAAATGQERRVRGPADMAFFNPWALKCHRDHLKKLGLLRSSSSSGSPAASAGATSSGGENSEMAKLSTKRTR